MNTPSKTKLRLMIVDDSEVVRMGLCALLGAAEEIEVVGEAQDVKSAFLPES